MPSRKSFDVYGLGSAIMDYQINISEAQIDQLGLTKGAMKLVSLDEQSKILKTIGSGRIHRASGGSAANSMIALSQLGGLGAFCCLVGDDADGDFYFEEMKSLGVELHTQAVPGAASGTSLILITPDAERTMNTHVGVNETLAPENIDSKRLAASAWVYLEGYLFSGESGQRTAAEALRLARENGVKIAISCSDGFIVDFFRDHLSRAVEMADLVFANLNEASKYTGESDPIKAIEGLRKVAGGAVVTLGADGALVDLAGEQLRVPGVKVEAVDATGAGDMFAGAFLYGICQDLGLLNTANLACRLSADVVSQVGPRIAGDIKRYLPK